jgi:hypothetical protein|nr:MAG TPA: hypothetical protein [Caudoviricetes sp.]
MEIQDIINMSKNTTITNNSQYDGDNRIQGSDVARDRLIQNTLDRMRHPASKVNIVADAADQAQYGVTAIGDSEKDNLHDLLNANGIFRPEDYDDYNSFYVFPRNDPYKMLGTTREYIFITKPDLHIFGTRGKNNGVPDYNRELPLTDNYNLNPELRAVPFFLDLYNRGYRSVLTSLQKSALPTEGEVRSPFVNILSNYKTSNLDLSDITVGEEETAANIYSTKIFYRKPSDSADEDNEFSLEFKDNKYLSCYLWFKAYDLYEQQKYHGMVTPTDINYIVYKILSDQMTVFKFIVGEDGETIIYWACLWGCYPKSVPRSTFSDLPTDGSLKFTVNWKATFQQDMDPMILTHFDNLCKEAIAANKGNFVTMDLYDSNIGAVTGRKATIPGIIKTQSRTTSDGYDFKPKYDYLLKWYYLDE